MRAPQLGKVRPPTIARQTPPRAEASEKNPNPEATKGLRVKPFANIFALVEGLGVVSLHRTEADAKTALEEALERRAKLSAELQRRAAPAEAHEAHEAEADR